MKIIKLNKAVAPLLALAFTGLPLLATASDTQTVVIKATVGETLTVEPVDAVNFGLDRSEKNVQIKIKSNLAGSQTSAKVTVKADQGDVDGDGFSLKHSSGESKMKIAGVLESVAFSQGQAEVTTTPDHPVTLHLTPEATQANANAAGEYSGSLTVKVAKS
ncbi:hypothetical protein ACSN7O_004718 [Enterobacter chuandaensis]